MKYTKDFARYYIAFQDNLSESEKVTLLNFVNEADITQVKYLLYTGEILEEESGQFNSPKETDGSYRPKPKPKKWERFKGDALKSKESKLRKYHTKAKEAEELAAHERIKKYNISQSGLDSNSQYNFGKSYDIAWKDRERAIRKLNAAHDKAFKTINDKSYLTPNEKASDLMQAGRDYEKGMEKAFKKYQDAKWRIDEDITKRIKFNKQYPDKPPAAKAKVTKVAKVTSKKTPLKTGTVKPIEPMKKVTKVAKVTSKKTLLKTGTVKTIEPMKKLKVPEKLVPKNVPKAGMKLGGPIVIAAAIAAASYIVYKRFLSQAARSCSGKSGSVKTLCMQQYKKKAIQARIKNMQSQMKHCNSTKDPSKCRAKTIQTIKHLQSKI